ncbi:endonuclease MutS2 [Inconstantimicrobium mannanitabidum]|uniref:Endonuclease MutS2 n=1 Tax=Inconstantimicrobium mannanitabidum TaxID=1604901 RepID=A0ACB5RCL3_9CLOT|nr:endonuclease MutS2 [Clostridium sp. TW13]GKX67012.1 endonuclease MutS2 [Clostridium sp. TW13]
MNINTLEKLSYYKLKEMVKSYCVSGLGKNLIDKLEPSTSMKNVNRMLDETSEGRKLIDAGYIIPLEGVFNILPIVDRMEKGAILEPNELTLICDFLRGCRKIKRFMENKEDYAPTLNAYAENITDLDYIEEEVNRSIRGTMVDSNASKELKKIRKNIDICEARIKERLDKYLKSSGNKAYIQEFFVSLRNGKYTIPIKASFKNEVKGTIVESSSNGSTVFIELESISKFTSEMAMLKAEESIEEYKILAALTDMVFEKLRDIKINIEVISEYDMILAKAKYSKEIDGIKPKLNDYGYTKIVKGRYPLIKNCVPLDFENGNEYRTLIITGPNAGGKTVVLKTVGLLTLAVQSGFHIAALEGTEIAVFNKIFADIGDDQSVENALSTFSSHVKNLAEIMRNSNKSTLLLFDEIGSGTEPNEGAALAIAVLEEFYKRGCITVATTHYGEIKNFSSEHPDFENAAMEFRQETLEPLYKLHIGRVGDSNALYIAKKMGIPQSIIEKTKLYIETKKYDYNLVKESKISKEKEEKTQAFEYEYQVGDKVLLLDKNESAIVYKTRDKLNNLVVLYNKEFIEVNYKRVKLELRAEELYPADYDLNQLFVSFKTRKRERDIVRGSKKALKQIRKESELNVQWAEEGR